MQKLELAPVEPWDLEKEWTRLELLRKLPGLDLCRRGRGNKLRIRAYKLIVENE